MNPDFFYHYHITFDVEDGRIECFMGGEPVLAARSPDIMLAFLDKECAMRGI